jgi:hypothetical protein
LKGRVIKYKPVAKLSSKSGTKKGGMRGGGWIDDLKDVSDIEKNFMKHYEIGVQTGQPIHNLGLSYKSISQNRQLELKKLVNEHWGWSK